MSVCTCPHCIHITAWHAKSSHLGYHLLLNDPRQKNMSQHRRASNASLSSSVMGTYFSEQNKVSPPKMFPYPSICFFKKPLEFLQKAHIHCKKKIIIIIKGKLIKNPFFFNSDLLNLLMAFRNQTTALDKFFQTMYARSLFTLQNQRVTVHHHTYHTNLHQHQP